MTRFGRLGTTIARRHLGAIGFAGALALTACGGATEPPQQALTADPPLGGPEGADRGAASSAVQRGIALIKNEKYAEARQQLEQAVTADPKNAEAAYYLGLAREKTKDRDGAEASYKAALAIDPAFVEASENLAAVYLDEPPRPDEAITVLKDALAKAPDNARLMQNLGYAYGLKGDVDGATKQYEAAIAKGDSIQLRFAYGSMLFEAKQHDRAVEQLKKALDGTADDAAMLATLGRMLGHSKAFGDCVKAFDRATKLRPKDPELLVRRGTCKHELKDEPGAKADYEAAIKVDPQFAAAHYYLGLSLLSAKQLQGAATSLERAQKLGEGTPIGKLAGEKLAELKGGGGKKKK
jgi:Flp pilus assembly protein TadD